ncbi:multicopper oxidase family protein, partial [Streptomyces sp. NPDC087437]
MTRPTTRCSSPSRIVAGLLLAALWLVGCAGSAPSERSSDTQGSVVEGGPTPPGAGPRLQDPPEVVSRDGFLRTT